jgi:hypothetical protein
MTITMNMGQAAHVWRYLNSLSDQVECSYRAKQRFVRVAMCENLIADVRKGIGPGMAENICCAAMGSDATLLIWRCLNGTVRAVAANIDD